MFERFTDRGRQVVVLAQEEARTLKHNYIGTEHILLGLLREEQGLAAHVLESLGITTDAARAEVVRIVGGGEDATEGQIPFTPRAKKVLELALRESRNLGHDYIGTEHLLLALVGHDDGVAVRILVELGADRETIRNELIRMLPAPEPGGTGRLLQAVARVGRGVRGGERPRQRPTHHEIDSGWLEGLGGMLDRLAEEIRRELGREPDSGDLLVALAVASDLPARGLQELGVDLDALWGQIERDRRRSRAAEEELDRQIEQARVEKERALEAQQFEAAARHRDTERELTERKRARTPGSPEALWAIRRRLGLPNPPEAAAGRG